MIFGSQLKLWSAPQQCSQFLSFQNYLLLYLLYWFTILILIHSSWISVACVCSCEWGKLWLLVTLLKILMNCFCGMVDRRNASSLIFSRDHCQKFSPSRISDTLQTGFEPAQNLNSGFVEWSCAVVITHYTTAPMLSGYPFCFNTGFILAFSLVKSSLLVLMEYALLKKEEITLFLQLVWCWEL